ncbi:hypothetical protein P5673_026493 [Acropora cervicornis]|uniref:Reverse transcriptase domain-containing protein n=1 Tax=Acropora cervicornis TaxID=6130 RepID=A0AAD9Q133_ACRCE|nr:hypothetical protein P5673_026493 [Acropora cervicornis]
MENQSTYKPSILEKLNKKEWVQHYRPSREPYINSYVEKLRQDIKEEISRHHRFQRNNLNKHERKALMRLHDNKNIIIKPAHKGGATVILNTENYITEAIRQLSNTEYYRKVAKDYTPDHENQIKQCINKLVDNGDLGKLPKATDSRAQIFYMLPKVHKPNNPGRPVVSSINSHMEKLSAYMDQFLRPLAEKLLPHIKDTTDLIKRLPENCILATLDVSSLYTNIDTNEGLTIVEDEFEKAGRNNPSAKTLACLLEKVLKGILYTSKRLSKKRYLIL